MEEGGMQTERFDRIIIGAGLYGLYAALFCGRMKQKVLVLEKDPEPFMRASYINQARVHQGYHYPRSLSTALKSAGYFERFNRDYEFCVNRSFDQIYATSATYSWTDGNQFRDFCRAAGIPCEELNPAAYFNEGMCDEGPGRFYDKNGRRESLAVRVCPERFLCRHQPDPGESRL